MEKKFDDELVSPQGLADHLQVSLRTLKRLEKRGVVPKPVIASGGIRRYSVKAIKASVLGGVA